MQLLSIKEIILVTCPLLLLPRLMLLLPQLLALLLLPRWWPSWPWPLQHHRAKPREALPQGPLLRRLLWWWRHCVARHNYRS